MTGPTPSDGDPLGWPVEDTVVLSLDLECDYGTAIEPNTYEAAAETTTLRTLLETYDLPLTCFLQTELLEAVPEAVATLERASVRVDFHAHSHTHPHPRRADVASEIDESLARIADRFPGDVVGYRFPDGAIPADGYRLLADRGVDFSSSLFPTWRPGRFDNRSRPTVPHEPVSGLLEVPITPLSSAIRIPVSLSYLKLLGRPYWELLRRRAPSVVVFDFHMHDLVPASAADSLSLPYRTIYGRNRWEGVRIFRRFVEELRRREYRFVTMTELYATLEDARSRRVSAVSERR